MVRNSSSAGLRAAGRAQAVTGDASCVSAGAAGPGLAAVEVPAENGDVAEVMGGRPGVWPGKSQEETPGEKWKLSTVGTCDGRRVAEAVMRGVSERAAESKVELEAAEVEEDGL